MPFLENSFHCLDCDWVGERRENCEKCGSLTVHPLSSWLNPSEQLRRVMEAPATTESRLRGLDMMNAVLTFQSLKDSDLEWAFEFDDLPLYRDRHLTSPVDLEADKSRTV